MQRDWQWQLRDPRSIQRKQCQTLVTSCPTKVQRVPLRSNPTANDECVLLKSESMKEAVAVVRRGVMNSGIIVNLYIAAAGTAAPRRWGPGFMSACLMGRGW